MEIKRNVVKAIVFDMDGTLLDTLQDLTNAVNVVLGRYGMPKKTVAEVCKVVGNGARNLVKGVLPGGENHPDFEAIFEDYKTYYAAHCEEETKPYEGILELLQELKKRNYKKAVVSNKPDGAVKILAEKYFPGCFQVAIGDMEGYQRTDADNDRRNCVNSVCGLIFSAEATEYRTKDKENDACDYSGSRIHDDRGKH